MKVLLDSNVIIAAFAARGLCNDLFEVCLEKHTIVLSPELLKEIEKGFTRKIKIPGTVTQEILLYLKGNTQIDQVTVKVDPNICRDPNDLHVLALAKQTRPRCIVSGDADLLSLGKFERMRILSPRMFWDLLKALK